MFSKVDFLSMPNLLKKKKSRHFYEEYVSSMLPPQTPQVKRYRNAEKLFTNR